jgi:hypothetical protein
MTAVAPAHWLGELLSQLLSHLPNRLHDALNNWSYRRARSRADSRRQAGRIKAGSATQAPAAPDELYKLRPWRD